MDKAGFMHYLESKELTVNYIARCTRLAERFFKQAEKEDIQVIKADILKYLEALNRKGLQNISRYRSLSALNHYFSFLYGAGLIDKNPCLLLKIRGIKRKILYKTYSPEELEALFDNYYQYFVRSHDESCLPENHRKSSALKKYRNAVIVSILIFQGAISGEIEGIEVNDIDLIKATVKIRGGRRSNGRTLPLKAAQIGLMMHYLQNIRPQLMEYRREETDRLVFPLFGNKNNADKDNILNVTGMIAKQLKTIDKQFLNFKQLRASVISFWIKTQGLRKAQYMAGHRYVSSTENYLSNNLEDLTEEINKLHPF